MNSGKLDLRVTFLQPQRSLSPLHEVITTYVAYAQAWAGRRDASAAEAYQAQEVAAEITLRLTVRSVARLRAMDPTFRVVVEGRHYNITGIRQVGELRRGWLEVDCVARAEAEFAPIAETGPLDTALKRSMSAGLSFAPVRGPMVTPDGAKPAAWRYGSASNYLPGTG